MNMIRAASLLPLLASSGTAWACLPEQVRDLTPAEAAAAARADMVSQAAWLLFAAAVVLYRFRVPLGELYQRWRARAALPDPHAVIARPPARFAMSLAAAGMALFLYSGSLRGGLPSGSCGPSISW